MLHRGVRKEKDEQPVLLRVSTQVPRGQYYCCCRWVGVFFDVIVRAAATTTATTVLYTIKRSGRRRMCRKPNAGDSFPSCGEISSSMPGSNLSTGVD